MALAVVGMPINVLSVGTIGRILEGGASVCRAARIPIAGGHTIVEMMRQGKSPTDACLEALHRVARNYNNDKKRLTTFHIFFYALNKDGVHGSASLWRNTYDRSHHAVYAVHDGTEARLFDCVPLFDDVGGDT